MSQRLILASGSQIRKTIMEQAGLDFEVIAKPVDEAAIKDSLLAQNVPMKEIADALAEAKAMRVSRTEDGLIIGSDQIMVLDGQLCDKPPSLEAARERLVAMRGKPHELIGAVVICENGVPVWRHMAVSKLVVRDFSDEFLDRYIEMEGEALTKSVGAYRFEGPGAQLFSSVEGSFFSILGLSLLPILDYLRVRGVIGT